MSTPDDILCTSDVAAYCGVTPEMVRQWERLGRLPATRTAAQGNRPGRRLFRRADVEAFQAARVAAKGPAPA